MTDMRVRLLRIKVARIRAFHWLALSIDSEGCAVARRGITEAQARRRLLNHLRK